MSAPDAGPDRPTGRPRVRVYGEEEIRRAVGDELALLSAERAFAAVARGQALVPPPVALDIPRVRGEVHVKGGHVQRSSTFAFKVATGFYGNADAGLPTGAGIVLVFDARTGFPLAVLADNGYLTDLRTAAAGALAVRLLAPDRPLVTAVLGSGVQARLQLRLMRQVRPLAEVRVWSPKPESRAAYAEEMSETLGVEVIPLAHPEDAVDGADLVVTATPSREPLVSADMLRPGVTVVALGSDGPEKRELTAGVLSAADKVVTDLTEQCARLGELHHAIEAGAMSADDVHAELGQVLIGARAGREGEETIVCDLTGMGAQDAAIAEVALEALLGSPPPTA